jgi:hypothetical protein
MLNFHKVSILMFVIRKNKNSCLKDMRKIKIKIKIKNDFKI